ncbi:MAG: nuclease [Actinomycetaceae bacterium]|nr:nuclease [Actinomycetaceae bacterium]
MYVLIDGENIDATLGVNILKRTPRAEERPRWDRVLTYNPFDPKDTSEQTTDYSPVPVEEPAGTCAPTPNIMAANVAEAKALAGTKGLFFLNATQRTAAPFVQALLAIGWTPIQLTSDHLERKIVDEGIQKTLDAIAAVRPGADVVVGSHDVDYLPQIEKLLDTGHRVAIVCFKEFLAMPLAELEERGLVIVDLEFDINAFNLPLNRTHPVDIDDFDPYLYI